MRAQWRWPLGLPPCRPLGNGLWEIRTDLPTKRTGPRRASTKRRWNDKQAARGIQSANAIL